MCKAASWTKVVQFLCASCLDLHAPGRKSREVTLLPCHPLEERMSTLSCVTIDSNAHALGLTDVYRTLWMSVAREECLWPETTVRAALSPIGKECLWFFLPTASFVTSPWQGQKLFPIFPATSIPAHIWPSLLLRCCSSALRDVVPVIGGEMRHNRRWPSVTWVTLSLGAEIDCSLSLDKEISWPKRSAWIYGVLNAVAPFSCHYLLKEEEWICNKKRVNPSSSSFNLNNSATRFC